MKPFKNFRKRQEIPLIKQSAMIIIFAGILFYGCDQSEEIPVPVNVEPSCIITSPQEGDEIDNYEDIIIEVDAEDDDGFITEVRFYINGDAAGSSNSFPYTYVLENPPVGNYEIKATALDAAGGSTSDQINVIITNIQDRLDRGKTPLEIFEFNNNWLDSLYGKMYQGGFIFYLDTLDGSGLVAALEDQSTSIVWANNYNTINNTKRGIGTGKANTEAIVKALGDGNYAAKLCDDLDLNGYSDWFLPSIDELNELIIRVQNSFIVENSYWSSNEYFNYEASICSRSSEYVYSERTSYKSHTNRVRAARAF